MVSSRGSSQPRDQTYVSYVSCIGRRVLYHQCHLNALFSSVSSVQSVQSLSRVRLFATPCIAARQASLSITSSRSSLRLASIESVMPSNHLVLCRPLLLLPPIPPSIRVFSNESTLCVTYSYYCYIFLLLSPTARMQAP